MGIPLSEATIRLVDGKNYAVLATVNPDGSPQASVVWVGRDGGDREGHRLRGPLTGSPFSAGRAVS